MNVLLTRPYPELRVSRVLERSFLRLEPLGLEIVAGGVPEEDEVSILDLSIESDPRRAFEERLRRERPGIVGFTGYSSHARQVRRLAGIAKAALPDSVVVVGGIHATIVPRDFATPDVDVIVRGEGGSVLGEIVRRLKSGRPLAFEGTALDPRSPSFDEECDAPPPPYPTYDEIPAPRRDLVERDRYFSVWTSAENGRLGTMFPRVAAVRTSVGCAYSCSFCVVHYLMGGKYVQRTPEDVVDEIAALDEDYVYFVDDEMFLNTKRTERIAELLIERGIRKKYYSWARSDTVVEHPELFRLWKRAGLGTIYVGLESMDDAHLDEYGKRAGADTNSRAVETLREIGVTLHGCFIVRPDFTVADFRSLEEQVRRIAPAEITFTVLSPSPGTDFWREQEGEFVCDPFYHYDCMHALTPTRLPLKQFYAHFSRLYSIALRNNPLRMNKVRVPFRDLFRAIVTGTGYIFSLKAIYKDYEGNGRRPELTD